jgi:lysophospholipase L1-like esterase
MLAVAMLRSIQRFRKFVLAGILFCTLLFWYFYHPGPSVVFVGDSYTGRWKLPNNYDNQGIDGQTTLLMLNRWSRDVILQNPKTVVLLAGANDIGLQIPLEYTEANISRMERRARLRGIHVVLCTIPPTRSKPYLHERIDILNKWIVEKAHSSGDGLADYHSALIGPDHLLRKEFAVADGVHLTPSGYAAIEPVIAAQLR